MSKNYPTQDELYKAVSESIREENITPATKEVLRYREALWEGYNTIQAQGKIGVDSIVSIFRQVQAI